MPPIPHTALSQGLVEHPPKLLSYVKLKTKGELEMDEDDEFKVVRWWNRRWQKRAPETRYQN